MFTTLENLQAEAGGTEEVARTLDRFTPDVAMASCGSSGKHLVKAVRLIQQRCPAARIVLLDETVSAARVGVALTLGAVGYWTMQSKFTQIVEVIRNVAEGEKSFRPASLRHISRLGGPLQSEPVAKAEGISSLALRECEILILLAKGLSIKECAEWLELSTSTISNHKTRMMKKLGARKTVDLARLAVLEGLIQ